MAPPRRQDILETLSRHKREFAEHYGVITLGVFGSVARDEAGADSDVDVVVAMSKPSLFSMVHIKATLEAELQRRVDIVQYWENMNPFLKSRIDREAHYV